MSIGKLSEILYNDNCGKPVIVNFQNGILAADKINGFRCGLYNDQEDNIIAAVATDKSIYSGKISRKDDLYNNFILTRNKKNGECNLIMVDKALLNIVTKSKRKLDIDDTSKQKKLSDLNKYFGSKRTKMVTEQNERLKVDVENIKTTLEQTAKETHVDESDIIPFKAEENDSSYRPPINRNASRVEDVYPLHVLVPPDILEELQKSADEFLESDEDKLKLCDFIQKQFVNLQQSTTSEKKAKAQLLLYIDCLINFVKQTARTISSKKFSACSYSPKVSAYILDNFTLMSATGRTRPISMRDKCICYILVLSMIAQNNVLNLELLTKDMKLGAKKLQDLSKVLAFTSKGSDKNIVSLNLPLPAPMSVTSGKRRR